jgi:hypothetical protein
MRRLLGEHGLAIERVEASPEFLVYARKRVREPAI